MNKRFKSVVAATFIALSNIAFAQVINLPTVEMLGGEYYFYEVEEADSAYGVAKKFGWDYDELCKLNPQVVKNMKKGALLYYPTGKNTASRTAIIPDQTNEAKVVSHVVRKGDTVYSIAAKYGIPIETIYANHPSAVDGIKEGETIRIDRTKKSDAQKEQQITQASSSQVEEKKATTPEKKASLPEIKVETTETQSAAPEQSIPANAGLVNLESVVESNSVSPADVNIERVSNIAVLLDNPSVKRDREFMRGFLIALKDMENSGQKVKLTALDATAGEEVIKASLDNLRPDVVVLTHDKDIPAWIVNYGNQNALPMVNVFDVKYSLTNVNPCMTQLLTPSKEFNSSIAEYMHQNMGDSKLIFVDAPAQSDGIAQALKQLWDVQNIAEVPFASLLEKNLREDGSYVIYVSSTKKDEILERLEAISKLKETTPLARVKVMGRPSWVTVAGSMKEHLGKADAYIPSRFYLDWDAPKTAEFVKIYENTYKTKPQITYPVFAVAGYDTAQCFIPSIAANGGDLSKGMLRGDTLQSDIILEKTDANGGFINKAVYLVRFTPFGTIEKIIAE